MREIKFNAVDEETGDYIVYNEWLNNDGYESGETPNEYLSAFLEFYFGYKLLQYTGLKDKNGKDIYEGDIICWENSDSEKVNDKVLFFNGAFRMRNMGFSLFDYSDSKIFEVIGNIYENKELIESN